MLSMLLARACLAWRWRACGRGCPGQVLWGMRPVGMRVMPPPCRCFLVAASPPFSPFFERNGTCAVGTKPQAYLLEPTSWPRRVFFLLVWHVRPGCLSVLEGGTAAPTAKGPLVLGSTEGVLLLASPHHALPAPLHCCVHVQVPFTNKYSS